MKAKKILAGVCASLMLAVTAAPMVSAADSVNVTVGHDKVKAGENFSVTVDLAVSSGSKGINGCDFGIKFDSTALQVTKVEAGTLAKEDASGLDGVTTLETNIETGLVSIVYGLASGTVTGSGSLVTISGTVKSGAKAGKSALEVVAVDRLAKPEGSATNSDILFGYLEDDNTTFTKYDPVITDGYVEITSDEQVVTEPTTGTPTDPSTDPTGGKLPAVTLLGDVDLNGEVGIGDVIAICKYLVNKSSYPLSDQALANADVTKNGVVDALDSQKLIEYNLKKISAL